MRTMIGLLAATTILCSAAPTWAGKTVTCDQKTWNVENDWNAAYASPNEANPILDSCGQPVWYFMRHINGSGYDMLDHYRTLYGCGLGDTNQESWEPSVSEWCDSCFQSCTPQISKHFSDQVWNIGWDVPAQAVTMHPGPSHRAVIVWKSPLRGNVSVTGNFTHLDWSACGNGVGWEVYKNGTLLAQGDLLTPPGQMGVIGGGTPDSDAFSFSREAVVKGDLFYFVVDPKGDVYCDSTQLKVNVQKVK